MDVQAIIKQGQKAGKLFSVTLNAADMTFEAKGPDESAGAAAPAAGGKTNTVMGIGGAGKQMALAAVSSSAVDAEYVLLNTDQESLAEAKLPDICRTLLIGEPLTEGLGAGRDPAVGREAVLQSQGAIVEFFKNTDRLFLMAGLGGGTGSGALPEVAQWAKTKGITVVALVSLPLDFEGQKAQATAAESLNALMEPVDRVYLIENEGVKNELSGSITMKDVFDQVNQALAGIISREIDKSA